jgi:hypothetical protein
MKIKRAILVLLLLAAATVGALSWYALAVSDTELFARSLASCVVLVVAMLFMTWLVHRDQP